MKAATFPLLGDPAGKRARGVRAEARATRSPDFPARAEQRPSAVGAHQRVVRSIEREYRHRERRQYALHPFVAGVCEGKGITRKVRIVERAAAHGDILFCEIFIPERAQRREASPSRAGKKETSAGTERAQGRARRGGIHRRSAPQWNFRSCIRPLQAAFSLPLPSKRNAVRRTGILRTNVRGDDALPFRVPAEAARRRTRRVFGLYLSRSGGTPPASRCSRVSTTPRARRFRRRSRNPSCRSLIVALRAVSPQNPRDASRTIPQSVLSEGVSSVRRRPARRMRR